MAYVTYRKFRTLEEAVPLMEILEDKGIEYQQEDIAPSVDVTFTGGSGLDNTIAIKLLPADFEVVEGFLLKLATDNLDMVDEDHYLFEFSSDELHNVLENFDEWSDTDFALAQKILKDRGEVVSATEVKQLVDKKLLELRKPQAGEIGWVIFGYISAVVGGVLGMMIGYQYFKLKKTTLSGDQVYAYNENTRKHGKRIFYIGVVSIIVWALYWTYNIVVSD